ncbi:MAG: tRNA dihydrouridine synthase DusB [Pseudomonadota bacterium]
MDALVIGPIRLPGRAILAPMSGVSDWPFRRLAARFGAPLVVSEMVASDRLVAREAEAQLKVEGRGLNVHAVQLAGCRENDLKEAAQIAEGAGAHLIDINMGCPAKRVVGGWAGSALMRDLDHAAQLIGAVVSAVSVPVTVKMRLGFDTTQRNAPELARRAEAEGARLVTVHGRTRCQRYKGRADWPAIKAVKEAVSIPVVANGDCQDVGDARAMLTQSGADAVMIGRAALGAPWLPATIAAGLEGAPGPQAPQTAAALGDLAVEHQEWLCEAAGATRGLRLSRKHTAAYMAHFTIPDGLRKAALTADDPAKARQALRAAFDAATPFSPSLSSSAGSPRAQAAVAA